MGYLSSIDVFSADGTSAPASSRLPSIRSLAIVLSAALLAAVLVRFIGLGSRALWLDEGYSAWFSELGWHALWFETPRYETHPPVYYSLLKLWRSMAGDDPAALRSLSAVAGVAAVPVVALAAGLVARLAGVVRPMAVIAVACTLAALSPRLVVIAQDARPYSLLLLANAIAIACWLRLTLSFRAGSHPDGRISDWMGLGGATATTLWLHGLGLLHAAALFGALLLTGFPGASRGRLTRMAITAGAVAIAYLPCFLTLLDRRGDWSAGWSSWDPARLPGALLDLYGLHEQTEPWTPVAARIIFATLIALGLRRLWSGGDRPASVGLGLIILLPPLAAALLSQLGDAVFVPRALVAVLAPAYLAAALGLAEMARRPALMLGAAAALMLAANLAQTLSRPSLEPWDEVATVLKREMRPGDVVWVYPNEAALAIQRALGAAAVAQPIPAAFPALDAPGFRPAASPGVVGITGAMARRWASEQKPASGTAWLVVYNPLLFDPDGEVARALADGRRPGRVREWRQITLRPLHPVK